MTQLQPVLRRKLRSIQHCAEESLRLVQDHPSKPEVLAELAAIPDETYNAFLVALRHPGDEQALLRQVMT